ncbi:MAG: hypothetical protein AAB426_05995 [Myxococcota bacterium]
MTEVYDEAAMRHYRDGELLRREDRVANADQLYGLAAECAIKSALVCLTGSASDGQLVTQYKEHIDRLWDIAPVQGLQKRYPRLAAVLKALRPFDDWSIRQRYEGDDAVGPDALEHHRRAASRILGSLQLHGAREEG